MRVPVPDTLLPADQLGTVHFVGIGGAGLSGIARIMLARGITVTEVSGVGLPAIYVPLPIGNGEQAHNARPVVDAGGGLLIADSALTPAWVAATVPDLLTDATRLASMSEAAAHVIPLDADDKLAEMILTARSRTSATRRADG